MRKESVKPEKHIKPRSVSGIYPAFCTFSCVVLFVFTHLVHVLSTECARACSLSAEDIPTLVQHPVNWVVIFVGKNS